MEIYKNPGFYGRKSINVVNLDFISRVCHRYFGSKSHRILDEVNASVDN